MSAHSTQLGSLSLVQFEIQRASCLSKKIVLSLSTTGGALQEMGVRRLDAKPTQCKVVWQRHLGGGRIPHQGLQRRSA